MKLEFYNCPKAEKFPQIDSRLRGNDKRGSGNDNGVALPETPEFVTYKPDFHLFKEFAKAYEKYENLLVIAHGGSVTSFYGFYHALKYQAKKQVHFLSTLDPDYIFELKQKLKPESTLVIGISKSGEDTSQIEELMPFTDYPLLIITGKNTPLRAIAEKLKAKIIIHPAIGGRYTGLTEVALLPAAIAGLDAEGLYEGAKKFYQEYTRENLAWKAASIFYQLEQKGFVDVFMPFYSHSLFSISALIVQLCHESFGKAGVGQTYFANEAPESQHHTNQRFFGGRKNICGFFTTVDSFRHPTVNIFPVQLHSLQMKGHSLFDISKIPLEKTLRFEAQATMEDARISGIPLAHLSISGFSPEEIGGLTAFWQLYAVYASVLRKVNPFDQPQVENSKNISFNKRLAFKGLL